MTNIPTKIRTGLLQNSSLQRHRNNLLGKGCCAITQMVSHQLLTAGSRVKPSDGQGFPCQYHSTRNIYIYSCIRRRVDNWIATDVSSIEKFVNATHSRPVHTFISDLKQIFNISLPSKSRRFIGRPMGGPMGLPIKRLYETCIYFALHCRTSFDVSQYTISYPFWGMDA